MLGVRVALIVATTLTGTPWYPAVADTLEAALAFAYQNNPQLNAQRAATRAVDENVGIALSIDRPARCFSTGCRTPAGPGRPRAKFPPRARPCEPPNKPWSSLRLLPIPAAPPLA
jgi:hypothetical protein